MHQICAFGGFISLSLSFIFMGYWYLSLVTAIVTVLTYIFSKKKDPGIVIWNTEIILIYCNFISLEIVLNF